MLEGLSFQDPLVVNAIGHTAGLFLFGLMIVLLLQDWKRNGIRQARLSLLAAVLALLWNLGGLFVLAISNAKPALQDALMTFSFVVLSLLPAVLFQLVLKSRLKWATNLGYLLSFTAAVLHIVENFLLSSRIHQAALTTIYAGFSLLIVCAAIFGQTKEKPAPSHKVSDLISLGCLLLLTLSFVHFGSGHSSASWRAEIAWHHIGIPLALVVLLQDYRFLLLDAFLRFVLNLGFAAAYLFSILLLVKHFDLWHRILRDRFALGVGTVLACLSLLVLIFVRNAIEVWFARTIFRRGAAENCGFEIQKLSLKCESESELIQAASQELANFATALRFTVEPAKQRESSSSSISESHSFSILSAGDKIAPDEHSWAEARIPLRFSQGDEFLILLGSRRGGRRYLSADFDALHRLAAMIVEQVERFRSEQLHRLVSQAELRALQAQINPHFLFNALNTLYGTIDRRSHQARRMVLNLAEIFRYFLQSDRTMIALEQELRIVKAYLEIEELRLGDRLQTELQVCDSALSLQIPVLCIQPLVENAVKHGISPQSGRGTVRLKVTEVDGGIRIAVEDTGHGFLQGNGSTGGAGVGLDNVRQRLRLCFGAVAELEITSSVAGTCVSFFVPIVSGGGPIKAVNSSSARSSWPLVADR